MKGNCLYCEKPFAPGTRGKAKRYCSEYCRRKIDQVLRAYAWLLLSRGELTVLHVLMEISRLDKIEPPRREKRPEVNDRRRPERTSATREIGDATNRRNNGIR
jgi:hypothetical protein